MVARLLWEETPSNLTTSYPGVAQMVARLLWEETPSNLTTSYPGVAQLVARLLWEQDAAGSNPVTRTTFLRKTA